MLLMRKLPLYIIVLAAVITAACSSSGCLDNGSALPLAGFYSSETAKAISVDSVEISGIGAPDDSVLLKSQNGVKQVYLPFNPAERSVRWCLSYRQKHLDFPEYNDTIAFSYDPITYFASEDCGAMYIYRITSVSHTSHLIDSITLVDSLITNVEFERIKIFFRTGSEEEPGQ